jgi:hypothetical protein
LTACIKRIKAEELAISGQRQYKKRPFGHYHHKPTKAMTEEIKKLSQECKKLIDQGAKLTPSEAQLFQLSVYNDIETCWKLVEAMRGRIGSRT